MQQLHKLALAALIAIVAVVGGGCQSLHPVGKVVLTPFTVVRDVVDVPLVSITNVFEYFADQTAIAKAPTAGVGWSWGGGFGLNAGYDLSHILFKGLSGIFGGIDYVICRSIWPNFARGISPWNKEGSGWGMLYFPNTRVLWGDLRPIYGNQWREGDVVSRDSSPPASHAAESP